MLRPSYSELMDAVMQGEQLDARVISRYTLVIAAAKRARQITDGSAPLTYAPTERAVSIAVKELHEGKLKIKVESDLLDGNIERMILQRSRTRVLAALSKDDLREDLKDNYEPDPYSLYDDIDEDADETKDFADDDDKLEDGEFEGLFIKEADEEAVVIDEADDTNVIDELDELDEFDDVDELSLDEE